MAENQLILNRLFSQTLFYSIVSEPNNKTYNTIVKRYVNNPETKNNSELISEIYGYMALNYRNEYYYQNTLLNKLLIGKHSLKTTTALTQIPVGRSKADFVLINGKAVVYEIKTELDTFDRLEGQLEDYFKAFNYVCVVTSPSQFQRASKLLKNTNVGIYVVSDKGTISNKLKKEPIADDSQLDYDAIFKVMRKKEYEAVLFDYYGYLPQTTQVFYYGECLSLFKQIPMNVAYELYLKQIKKRNKMKIGSLAAVPGELRSLVYFSNPDSKSWRKIATFLNKQYEGGKQNVLTVCQRASV